jgi:hypothetical protein
MRLHSDRDSVKHQLISLLAFLICCLVGWPAYAQTASDTLHLWAQELDASGDPLLIQLRGQSRLFAGDLRLLADQIRWAPDADLVQADGHVDLAAPDWQLLAETLEFHPAQAYLHAQNLSLQHRGLTLKATSADMTAEVWRLNDVEIRLEGSLLVLQAAHLRILPGRSQENLLLEEAGIPGLPLTWPVLTLSLPELGDRSTELRAPISAFQPELGLVAGGLRLGFSSQLWQDASQRLYGRLVADPVFGPLAEFSHEWRPDPGWLLHSQLGFGSSGLQARAEALWQTPLGPWLRGRARLQQSDSFLSEFWLPPLKPVLTPVSGLEIWSASEWLDWQSLRFRILAGARWPQQQAGLTGLAMLPIWQQDAHLLEASLLLNGLAGSGPLASAPFNGTAGGRLLYQWQANDSLTLGTYFEQYLSSLPSGSFLQPDRLSPWLAGVAFWRPHENLGIALELALSLTSGHIALADALISWHIRPFYIHLLLQGVPTGLQLQTRFEL